VQDDRSLLALVRGIVSGGQTYDDCAVLEIGGEWLVVTTDMLHETTDFPDGMTEWQMGWMSVAVTLSDVAAMGATPRAMLLAVGLDRDDRFVELMQGAGDCCRRYGAELIGGDIDRHDELTVVSTGIGTVAPEHLVRRRGARPGDLVAVTGPLGEAQAGLLGFALHRTALLEPQPRVVEGQALGRAGATSMMDISDGLSLSLYDLLEASGYGPVSYPTRTLPRNEGV